MMQTIRSLSNLVIQPITELWCILFFHARAIFLPKPPSRWRTGDKGDVILLQGYGEPYTFLESIGNRLNSSGFRVHVISSLERNRKTIQQSSTELDDYLRENAISSFSIVAHSKGGLIAAFFLQNSTFSSLCESAYTITVPFGGTYLGYLRILNLHELRPNSEILKRIQNPSPEYKKIVNFYSKFDQVIPVQSHSRLREATNIKVNYIGHAQIARQAEVIEQILGTI
jgi:hypothetical protein